MERQIYFILSLWLVSGSIVLAGVDVQTIGGKVYQDAELKSVESGVVVLSHSGGVAKVALSDLSKPVRESLGIKPTLETAKDDFDGQIRAFKKNALRARRDLCGAFGEIGERGAEPGAAG